MTRHVGAIFLVTLILATVSSHAQDRKDAKTKNPAILFFPNDRYVRGELISMSDLAVTLEIDGKSETYHPALHKVLAVRTRDGWQLFDSVKKKFAAATQEQVAKVVGKSSLRPGQDEDPASRTSGPVTVVNTNKETIRIVAKSFVDAQGKQRAFMKTFDVKGGESEIIAGDNGEAIRASQFSFRLITKDGASDWSVGLPEFDGTSLQVVVRGDMVLTARVTQTEPEKRLLAEMRPVRVHLEKRFFDPWLQVNNKDKAPGGILNPEFRQSSEGAHAFAVYCVAGALVCDRYRDYLRSMIQVERDVGLVPASVWKACAQTGPDAVLRPLLDELFPTDDAKLRQTALDVIHEIGVGKFPRGVETLNVAEDKALEEINEQLNKIDAKLPVIKGFAKFCYEAALALRARGQPAEKPMP